MQVAAAFAIFAIGFYQKRISPHKGFVCAHRAYHGGLSCSECAKQTIATHGLWCALPLIKARFVECRGAYTLLSSSEGGDKLSRLRRQGDACANVCTLPCL